MSITDELRVFARRWPGTDYIHKDMLAIADRIDAEHAEAIQQALMGEGGVPATDENMAEHGWVRLPLDADGEYIHVGDRLTDGKHTYTVTSVTFDSFVVTVYGHSETSLSAWPIDQPGKMRHHHAPTVEDVLREFGKAWVEWEDGSPYDPIAKYAKRLTLAEGEDA